MQNATLPSGLRSLAFGHCSNRGMQNVVLPSGSQSLTFGNFFNQRMQMQIDIPNPRSTLGSQAVLTLPRFSYIALQKVPYALGRRSRSVDAGRGVLDQDRPRR